MPRLCRDEVPVARKQNFSYQKFQRENAKAAKREAKKDRRTDESATDVQPDLDRPMPGDEIEDEVDLDAVVGLTPKAAAE